MTKKVIRILGKGKDKGPYRHFNLFSLTIPMSAPPAAKITMLYTNISTARSDAGECIIT